MRRWLAFVLIIGAFGAGAGAGVLGILYATGGIAEPSREVAEVAPTLSLNQPTPTLVPLVSMSTQVAEVNEKVDQLATQVADQSVLEAVNALNERIDSLSVVTVDESTGSDTVSTPAATVAATAEPEATDETAADAASGSARTSGELPARALFRIASEDSEARFYIDETLAGVPTTVVGTTNAMAGDIIVNFENPSGSQVGNIAVNARTLRTDTPFRDQSIHSLILRTREDDNEFITFAPTGLLSMTSDSVSVGDTVEFEMAGDLTISGETRPVTFTVEVTVVSPNEIAGLARTEILYADYGITINNPPANVADIGDVVTLEFDFVARTIPA
ncbi:MAG: YceI family protein [Chloroflexi bacterium]|nr:YceI family protein [Chloroflexota bacterium]